MTGRRGASRHALAAIVVAVIASLALAGCGSKTGSATGDTGSPDSAGATPASTGAASDCPTSNTTSFAKTKFVLHLGLAAGTFHRYLYKPFKAGTFTKGAHGRTLALIKGGAVALFDVRELKKAAEDVRANPTLCKLVIAPMNALSDKLAGLKSKLFSGDTSALEDINNSVSGLESLAGGQGVAIVESTDQNEG